MSRSRAHLVAPLTAAFVLAQQVGSNALRDALFLSWFPVTTLPWFVAARRPRRPGRRSLGPPARPLRAGPSRPGRLRPQRAVVPHRVGALDTQPRAASVLLYVHASVLGRSRSPLLVAAQRAVRSPLRQAADGAGGGGRRIRGLGRRRRRRARGGAPLRGRSLLVLGCRGRRGPAGAVAIGRGHAGARGVRRTAEPGDRERMDGDPAGAPAARPCAGGGPRRYAGRSRQTTSSRRKRWPPSERASPWCASSVSSTRHRGRRVPAPGHAGTVVLGASRSRRIGREPPDRGRRWPACSGSSAATLARHPSARPRRGRSGVGLPRRVRALYTPLPESPSARRSRIIDVAADCLERAPAAVVILTAVAPRFPCPGAQSRRCIAPRSGSRARRWPAVSAPAT